MDVTFPEFSGLRCLMMPYIQGESDSENDRSMSAWHSEIREEGVKWACFAEGGVRDPRMDHFMASSYQEARDWVDAAYIRKTTPKVKKPAEPVYVSELDDIQHHVVVPDGGVVVPAGDWAVTKPPMWPADEPNAPEAAETATGDQAASVGAYECASAMTAPMSDAYASAVDQTAPKRRGRPPKVSA